MSTLNATPNGQTPLQLPERMPSEPAEPKFTASDIEKDCPVRLQEIGREIKGKLDEVREQTRRLDDHAIAINKLLTEARELCDVDGFDKFRELFCPQLGKSQAYVRLAIAAGKTTLVGHRAKERERKQRARANQKAAAANSGTVPEECAPQDASEARGTPEPTKPRGSRTPGRDGASCDFSARVLDLYRRIDKKPAGHFAGTTVPVDQLAQLGKLLTDIADLKKSEAVKPAPIMASTDNGTVSGGQSALKAEHPALEPSVELAA